MYIPLNLKIELENLTVAYEKLNANANFKLECRISQS